MKLDFMTWVIFNTDHKVEELDNVNSHYFKFPHMPGPNFSNDCIWAYKNGSGINCPERADINYIELISMSIVPEYLKEIKKMLIVYHNDGLYEKS